jgi:glycolate oxidase
MALSRDVYRELEDILGVENISEDSVILDGYSYQVPVGLLEEKPDAGSYFFPRPEAVVLPGSAKDVQAIIKLCNRRGLKSRASSTSFGHYSSLAGPGEIFLDLRRMNRILEIDEKNMHIVVEPYVSFAQVQAEAMKRGLNCLVIGAGSQTSFLASHTSVVGNNTQGMSQGFSGRNLLGVEWVLPTGEIVRLGAPGSGAGWFSGDGPGPSLRGIIRGAAGAKGALGVFTKCAGQLHPWPGPTEMMTNGSSPYFETEVPPLFEYHMIEFPSWEQYAEAVYRIGGARIAYALHKTGGPGSHGSIVTGSNNEYYEKRQAGKFAVPEVSFAIVLAANSPGEHEYQVKTFNKILADTGGKISPIGEEPTFKKRDYLHMIKTCFVQRMAFRISGSFCIDGMAGMETLDNCALGLKLDGRLRDKWAKKGVIMDDGTYNSWGVSYEGSHFAQFEAGHSFDPHDDESRIGMSQMRNEGTEITFSTPCAISWVSTGEITKVIGPRCGNFQDWLRKIKKTFDPNAVSDPAWYVSAEEG